MSPELAHDVALDREQAFLLYATFCGDLEKTAHALNIRPAQVLAMADEEGWNNKLKAILDLKKSARPGDIERGINRALNFVMAHKFRMFLERVLFRITGMSQPEFDKYLLQHESKDGTFDRMTTRSLADLASAMEKAHAMSYMALNDTAPERARRKTTDDDSTSSGELNVRIAEAMAQVRASKTPRAVLFDAQVAQGGRLAADSRKPVVIEPTKPTKPYDSDEH